ncbi:NAD(P)-binding protein [Sodiomyces alkalinus F11]|uniref:NAD(P)-binding protein n=1 Tax=Sodiomyces alkalinus (strain CBS 110278 / VKM F-3762 / F11) TaxID=1314773 RepID=A0A3N2PLX2_SODAK|nr:NAD(P)-binding protein [Sodiomyces alkalinus F11]ROT35479.1 NAD(P)-binding protein [Sodiomyces alkalinus F11]
MPFPYKTVLVTGATSGIGRGLAERLIEQGVFVIAVGRRKDRLDALVERHGGARVASEPFDISNLEALPSWTEKIISTYPSLDAVLLNAGVQRSLNFNSPGASSPDTLAQTTSELVTNYISPLHTTLLFLPHLRARAANGDPAAILLVSSSLALVPISRCPNYCASKAALHSLAWQLRAQLQDATASEGHSNQPGVRVIEIIPPAVQTELHTQQGLAPIGMPLEEFLTETWLALERGDQDEILVGPARDHSHVEEEKRRTFAWVAQQMKLQGSDT